MSSQIVATSDRTPLVESSATESHRGVEGITAKAQSGSLWRASSLRQKMLFVYIYSGQLAVFLCVSIPNSFMTKTVLEKGGKPIESSIVLQALLVSAAISSAVFGKYQAYMNSKVLLLVGLTMFCICQASFGFLVFTANVNTFVAIGVIIRVVQGIGRGAFVVAALTIICQEFEEHAAKAFSLGEAVIAIGYISGPMLGSSLYSISNSILLPFVVSSVLIVPLILIGFAFLGNYRRNENDKNIFQIKDILCKPWTSFILAVVAVTNGGFAIIIVIGSVYMQSRGFTIIQVGVAFVTMSACYSISTASTGYIAGYKRLRRTVYSVGIMGIVGSSLILSPNQYTIAIFVGMALYGVCAGFANVCGFSELLYLAADGQVHMVSDFTMHSAVSGAWNLFHGFGSFFISLVGSQLYTFLPFYLDAFICLAVGLCLASMISIALVILRCKNESL